MSQCTDVCFDLSSQLTNIFFCQKLLLEMKYGAFNMIPKANDKVCNGKSPQLHNPKKLARQNHK
jgi:hypothetical protein